MSETSILSHIVHLLAQQDEQLQQHAVLNEALRSRTQCLEDDMSNLQNRLQEIISNDAALHGPTHNLTEEDDITCPTKVEVDLHEKPMEGDHLQEVHNALKQAGEYQLGESMYDASFFWGSHYLSRVSWLLIFLGIGFNVLMQASLVMIIENNLTTDPFPPGHTYELEAWRARDGHSYIEAERLTGVSLVARVCNFDGTLSKATGQLFLHIELDRYLKDGRFLCWIAILLWAFCCVCEIRKSCEFALALGNLPLNHDIPIMISVTGDGLRIESVGCMRKLIGFLIVLCRIAVASMLCLFGSQWLALTTSVENLLLNASALGFALDIDEEIYGIVAPVELIRLTLLVQPLKLPAKKGLVMLPASLLAGTLAYLFVFDSTILKHMDKEANAAINTLCSPSMDVNFIMSANQMGFPIFSSTMPYDQGDLLMSARLAAARMISNKDPYLELYAENVTMDVRQPTVSIESKRSQTLAEIVGASETQCVDTTTDQKLGLRLWLVSGNASLQQLQVCADATEFCTGDPSSYLVANVRFMCPITCGCVVELPLPIGCPGGCWTLYTETGQDTVSEEVSESNIGVAGHGDSGDVSSDGSVAGDGDYGDGSGDSDFAGNGDNGDSGNDSYVTGDGDYGDGSGDSDFAGHGDNSESGNDNYVAGDGGDGDGSGASDFAGHGNNGDAGSDGSFAGDADHGDGSGDSDSAGHGENGDSGNDEHVYGDGHYGDGSGDSGFAGHGDNGDSGSNGSFAGDGDHGNSSGDSDFAGHGDNGDTGNDGHIAGDGDYADGSGDSDFAGHGDNGDSGSDGSFAGDGDYGDGIGDSGIVGHGDNGDSGSDVSVAGDGDYGDGSGDSEVAGHGDLVDGVSDGSVAGDGDHGDSSGDSDVAGHGDNGDSDNAGHIAGDGDYGAGSGDSDFAGHGDNGDSGNDGSFAGDGDYGDGSGDRGIVGHGDNGDSGSDGSVAGDGDYGDGSGDTEIAGHGDTVDGVSDGSLAGDGDHVDSGGDSDFAGHGGYGDSGNDGQMAGDGYYGDGSGDSEIAGHGDTVDGVSDGSLAGDGDHGDSGGDSDFAGHGGYGDSGNDGQVAGDGYYGDGSGDSDFSGRGDNGDSGSDGSFAGDGDYGDSGRDDYLAGDGDI